jgi:predicted DNA-binding protein
MNNKDKKYVSASPKLVRNKQISFRVNEEELKAIDGYLSKYKIHNRSYWFRETIMRHILKVLEQDYPTLFGENDMRR